MSGRPGRSVEVRRPSARWARSWPVRGVREAVQIVGLKPLVAAELTVEVHGLEHLPRPARPVLLVANHSSHLDTPLVLNTLPATRRRRTAVAAAADYFFDSGFRAGATGIAFNAFPISRGPASSRHADPVTACIGLLADGWSVLMFPEGTRSPDGYFGEFAPAVAEIALDQGVPVVPIGLRGTFAAHPRGSAWPQAGRPRVSVRYGAPITAVRDESVSDLLARIQAGVQLLIDEDEGTWWSARRDRVEQWTHAEPTSTWRRVWAQSGAAARGGRSRARRIWR
ncbi:MAG: lysophospholipid acyltransferase family protein [Propionibacteriaceae bacterium]